MDIKLIVIDIDGTMTDGSIYYSEEGVEIKKFNVKDAAGILSAQSVGIECMFLTGRKSMAVERRAQDLNVKYVVQGIKDKYKYIEFFLKETGRDNENVLYIGDDINDFYVMKRMGYAAAPSDAAEEVLKICDYISLKKGGEGAVRDIIFHYIKQMGVYEKAIEATYGGI